MMLLEGSREYLTLRDDRGRAVTDIVCSNGRIDIAKRLLLQFSADFTTLRNGEGRLPIHDCFAFVWIDQDLEAVAQFFDSLCQLQSVTFNETTSDGRTPLHLTIGEGRGCLVDYLLKKSGIGINIQNSLGVTPLMLSLQLHLVTVSHKLLDHGADVFIQTNFGESTLSVAKEINNDELLRRIQSQFDERRHKQLRHIVREWVTTEETFYAQMEYLYYVFQTRLSLELSLSPLAIQVLAHSHTHTLMHR
jgi:ankyrin repeat protein